MDGAATLAGGEVLAAFEFGGGFGEEFLESGRPAWLADGMFAGAGLAGSEGAGHGGGWEAGGFEATGFRSVGYGDVVDAVGE